MPYTIETADGIEIANIPDNVPRDSPVLRQRVLQARFQRRRESPEYQANVEAQREADRQLYDPTAGMSTAEKLAANWSAGYGNLTQGIRQLAGKVGIGSGVSDEEIREKRRIDKMLADATTGGKALQITSEVLPTLAVPAGLFAQPALRGAQALPLAGRFVPSLGSKTALLGSAATGSAASAALSPVTEDESRGANMAAAGLIGAAIPGAGAAGGAAVRGARNLLTDSGAARRAVEAIGEVLPSGRAGELAERLATTRRAVPTSAAQATGDPYLAQLEAASRSKPSSQPHWAEFDTAQNAARFEQLAGMTPSELRLERLANVRTGRTTPLREAALAEAAQRGNYAPAVVAHVSDVLQGPSGANPAVQKVGKYVMDELGASTMTPARLYEVRKTLASKLSGPSAMGDEMAAAAKGAQRETKAMIQAIDDALDSASNSQWSAYLGEYGKRSKPITSGAAMREAFERIEQKPLKGTTPEVTYAGLQTATRGTQGKFGDKLQPELREELTDYMQRLREAEAVARTRKLSATMGGQSITNSDQLLANFTKRIIDTLPGVGGYAERISNLNREQVERHMARLLQNPDELGTALRTLSPSQRQQLLDEALRASALTGAAEATR